VLRAILDENYPTGIILRPDGRDDSTDGPIRAPSRMRSFLRRSFPIEPCTVQRSARFARDHPPRNEPIRLLRQRGCCDRAIQVSQLATFSTSQPPAMSRCSFFPPSLEQNPLPREGDREDKEAFPSTSKQKRVETRTAARARPILPSRSIAAKSARRMPRV